MLVYYINFALILGLAYPLCVRKPNKAKTAVYLAVTFAYMLFLSATRSGIGHDYQIYLTFYEEISSLPWGNLPSYPLELGYVILNKLLAPLQLSPLGFYLLMGVICLAPVVWFIYRYSPMAWLSAWLYATLTFYLGTMNFIRQNIAVAILLLGYPLLRKRKLWAAGCYAAVILLAASFHKTALMMLPVLLACYLPFNRWTLIAYGSAGFLLFLCAGMIVDYLTGTLFPSIPFLAPYAGYRDTVYLMGLSAKFLILPALIFALILIVSRRMQEEYPRDGALMSNMILYSTIIWLFIIQFMVLERFSLYVYIYTLQAVPMAAMCLRPSPKLKERCEETSDKMKKLREQNGARSGAYKALNMEYAKLQEEYNSQKLLWGFLLAAILLSTFIYFIFGANEPNNGFHGVFPYRSMYQWINRLP